MTLSQKSQVLLAIVTAVWAGSILLSRHPEAAAALPSGDEIASYATSTTDQAIASIREIFATDR
jgi:hypothetical protein